MVAPTTLQNFVNNVFDFLKCGCFFYFGVMLLKKKMYRRWKPDRQTGKASNGNVKHFVFDLTCDVTGDPEVKFLNFISKISSRPFHCRLNFSPYLLVSEIVAGAATPPPPPPAEGRVRTRPSRAWVNTRTGGGSENHTDWRGGHIMPPPSISAPMRARATNFGGYLGPY